MSPLLRRILGYGLATPIAAGLIYVGFFREVPDDPQHALLQAEIKLRFASRMPPQRGDGSRVAEREELIADAVRYIDEAERLAAPTAMTVEYRAFVDYLQGDARAAAAGYSRAETLASDAEAKGQLALSAARMLALAGEDGRALAELDARMPTLPSHLASGANVERMRILARQGRGEDAARAAQAVLDDVTAAGEDLVGVGEWFESRGDDDMAATAYERAMPSYPLANYFVARLKARGGDVDNAVKMLECALSGAGKAVRSLLNRDRDAWQACAGDQRFQSLFPEMEAARPGR
ncbi:MAG: hypothetical protein R3F56_06085 [Planctomycetota bacterium]